MTNVNKILFPPRTTVKVVAGVVTAGIATALLLPPTSRWIRANLNEVYQTCSTAIYRRRYKDAIYLDSDMIKTIREYAQKTSSPTYISRMRAAISADPNVDTETLVASKIWYREGDTPQRHRQRVTALYAKVMKENSAEGSEQKH